MSATRTYAKQHHLNELFVHFLQLLLYYRPENPRSFLVQEIRSIREQKVSTSLFSEKDLETMFDLIDVTRQQSITVTQLRNACRNLSTTPASSPSPAYAGEAADFNEEEAAVEAAICAAADANGLVSLDGFKKVLTMLLVTKNMWSE